MIAIKMNRNRILAQILNGIGIVSVLIVILAVLPLSLPKLAGIRVFGVLTGSMEPEYGVGGVVYVRQCDADKLQVGDVITFRMGSATDAVMTHRIVAIDREKGTFLTKGDANDTVDPEPVQEDCLIGKVLFYLPGLAAFASALGKPEGIAAVMIVFMMAVVCWMLADIVRRQSKDMLRPAVRVVALAMIIGAGCYLGSIFWQYQAGEHEYEDLARQIFAKQEDVKWGVDDAEQGMEGAVNVASNQGQDATIHSGVKHLMQTNEDMIGWIAFANLDISYPIMQGEDNAYYLNHTFSGEKNSAGSIFVDAINHSDFEDAHTIVYGHNMKNLSMFGSLRSYKTKDFYEENEYFYIYTDSETYCYQIFSYYDVSEYSDIYTVWYTPDESFGEMVDRMKKRSYYDTGVEVSGEDKIITLSTCSTEGNRFVIHARRVE